MELLIICKMKEENKKMRAGWFFLSFFCWVSCWVSCAKFHAETRINTGVSYI